MRTPFAIFRVQCHSARVDPRLNYDLVENLEKREHLPVVGWVRGGSSPRLLVAAVCRRTGSTNPRSAPGFSSSARGMRAATLMAMADTNFRIAEGARAP